MPDHIELHDKSDRDLMVIAVTKLNAITDQLEVGSEINRDLQQRVSQMESRCKTIHGNGPPFNGAVSRKRAIAIQGGTFSVLLAIYEGIKAILSHLGGS